MSSQLPSVITFERGQEDRRVPSTRKNRKHVFSRCVGVHVLMGSFVS